MDIDTLENELARQEVQRAIEIFADREDFELSPRQVIANPVAYVAGRAGHGIGKLLGLKKRTDRVVRLEFPLRSACIAFIMVTARHGIDIQGLDTEDRCIFFDCEMPGNWAVFEGRLEAKLSPRSKSETEVALSVTFEGQMFTWGEGSRRINRITTDLNAAFDLLTDHSAL